MQAHHRYFPDAGLQCKSAGRQPATFYLLFMLTRVIFMLMRCALIFAANSLIYFQSILGHSCPTEAAVCTGKSANLAPKLPALH